jgi:hypothetical protein
MTAGTPVAALLQPDRSAWQPFPLFCRCGARQRRRAWESLCSRVPVGESVYFFLSSAGPARRVAKLTKLQVGPSARPFSRLQRERWLTAAAVSPTSMPDTRTPSRN